jgi:hypothetical protein
VEAVIDRVRDALGGRDRVHCDALGGRDRASHWLVNSKPWECDEMTLPLELL